MQQAQFADSALPQVVDDAEIAVFDGEAVVFHAASRTVHRLQSVAGAVWFLCDGHTSVGEMAGILADLFGTTEAELQPPIRQALMSFAQEGLLLGVEPPLRLYPEQTEERAIDGSRLLGEPPDT